MRLQLHCNYRFNVIFAKKNGGQQHATGVANKYVFSLVYTPFIYAKCLVKQITIAVQVQFVGAVHKMCRSK
jgi:hypothetical protein